MSVDLIVTQFRANSLDATSMELRWAIADTGQDVLDYTFTVLRGESVEGPFEPITAGFKDRYAFVDKGIPAHHRWRQLHYLLRVVRDVSGDGVDFGPVRQEVEPDLVAVEIRSHMTLLFTEHAGRRCWVLPVRTFGTLCSCVNPVTKARKRSNCVSCYDTGFLRGYHHPIESYIQFDPSPKIDQVTNAGRIAPVNTTARVTYYPPLKPRDIIVEGENRRWRVNKVAGTEHSRAVIHQELELHEIPSSDIEFSIPLIRDGIQELRSTPSRNYTNPQNLESVKGDTPILGFDALPPLGQAVPSSGAGAPPVPAVFSHRQEVASTNWVVNHQLGRYPVVVVTNLAGEVLDVAVTYVSPNQVRITPLVPFSGIARFY